MTPQRRLLQALLTSVVLIAGLFLLQGTALQPGPPSVEVHWTFEALDPSAADTAPQTVVLPDQWNDHRRGLRRGRYVGTFTTPEREPDADWLAYLTSVGGHLAVSVNGRPLDQGHGLQARPVRYQPLRLELTPFLQDATSQRQRIEIEIESDRYGGTFLGAVHIGSESALGPAYAKRLFVKRQLPTIIAASGLLLGAISFLLWRGRQRDRVYLWHSLACLSSSLYALSVVRDPWLPAPWWDAAGLLCAAYFGHCCAWLGMHFYGVWPKALKRSVLLFTGLAAPVMLIGGLSLEPTIFIGIFAPVLWLSYQLIVVAFIVLVYVDGCRRVAGSGPFWMLVSALVIGFGDVPDGLVQIGLLDASNGLITPYSLAVPMASFLGIFIQRFRNALGEAESLNQQLEQRIAEREAQLESNFLKLQQAERSRSIAVERERLFREMHDGMGGALVSALARLSNEGAGEGKAAYAVKRALDDLRLMLMSMDPDERSLRAALAVLRERIRDACEDASINLHFDMQAIPDTLEVPSERLLQLLRVLQEASANSIRHAAARSLSIRVELDPETPDPQLRIEIDDDGIGFSPGPAKPGHYGIANLRKRVAALDGHIEWLRLSPGTRVLVRVPMVSAPPGP